MPGLDLKHFAGWGRDRGTGVAGRLVSHWSKIYVPCHELEVGGTPETRRNCPILA